MKFLLNSILFFIFMCYKVYSQVSTMEKKEFVLDTVQKYEVADALIYNLLDTLLANLDNCIFTNMDRDFFFYLYIKEKENDIQGEVFTYSSYTPLTWFKRENFYDKGFFFYKNRLVLVIFERKDMVQCDTKIF